MFTLLSLFSGVVIYLSLYSICTVRYTRIWVEETTAKRFTELKEKSGITSSELLEQLLPQVEMKFSRIKDGAMR